MKTKLKFLTKLSNKTITTFYTYNTEFRVLLPIETTNTINNKNTQNQKKPLNNVFCVEMIENKQVVITKIDGLNIHKEIYNYNELYINELIDICEKLIQFIEANCDLITDKKIFNLQ